MINWTELIKDALKNKETLNLKVYRNIKSEIQKWNTTPGNKEMTDADEISILKSMIKTLKKSENEYFQAGRQDLVADCTAEREVIESFLPQAPTPEILKISMSTLDWVKSDPITGIFQIDKKDQGKTIKAIKALYPAADGKIIADIVKESLV